MASETRAVATADGTSISYSVFEGTEPAVVILHGLAGSSREFIPTARALAGRKVILIDQRGHGQSTRMPADTSREAFVGDVVCVLAAEGLGVIDLVGQSMGAHTAMLVAATHPEVVRRLVLLECAENESSAEDAAAIGEFFRSWELPFVSREAARVALGDSVLAQAWAADLEERPDGLYPRFDPDVMVATITDAAVPRWDEWKSIAVPTLVIFAENGMFTEEQKIVFIESSATASRIDLSSASHDAHLDSFNQWIEALNSFIRDL